MIINYLQIISQPTQSYNNNNKMEKTCEYIKIYDSSNGVNYEPVQFSESHIHELFIGTKS